MSEMIRFVFSLAQGFDHFRADKTLCDVILVPGDSNQSFPVHRVIMASSSDYFKAMFTGEWSPLNNIQYKHPLQWPTPPMLSSCFFYSHLTQCSKRRGSVWWPSFFTSVFFCCWITWLLLFTSCGLSNWKLFIVSFVFVSCWRCRFCTRQISRNAAE